MLLLGMVFLLAACSTTRTIYDPSRSAGKSPHYKVGKPYKVKGRWYRPEEDADYEKVGVASWYGRDFHGKRTANGETYDMNRLSAAHTTLPMPSMVEVTNLKNNRKIVVRVNDRGPFADDRIIDLSREAARRLGFESAGLARVKVRFVGPAPLLAKAPKTSQPARYAAAPEQPAMQRPPFAKPAVLAPIQNDHGIRVTDGTASQESHGQPTALSVQTIALEMAPVDEVVSLPIPVESPGPVETTGDEPGLLYVIRIAALSQLDNIEALKSQLEPIGPLRLSRVESDTGSVFYRVNMGPFASLDTANEGLDAVRNAGYDDAGIINVTP